MNSSGSHPASFFLPPFLIQTFCSFSSDNVHRHNHPIHRLHSLHTFTHVIPFPTLFCSPTITTTEARSLSSICWVVVSRAVEEGRNIELMIYNPPKFVVSASNYYSFYPFCHSGLRFSIITSGYKSSRRGENLRFSPTSAHRHGRTFSFSLSVEGADVSIMLQGFRKAGESGFTKFTDWIGNFGETKVK
ncbi:unnamed protein product [Lactuca saligna]|uniref:Uncharacterized protein n=1 Tax=Lactuca saligna TaxID=75948 RepID=A0AA35VU26_LACSI|nr:unnamed protein product [Lactuca saligna]